MQNPALSVGVSAGIGTSGVATAPSQLPEFLRGGRRVGAPTAASNSGTPQRSAIGAPDPATAANVTAAVDAHIAVLALAAAASAADHPPNGTNADIWADAHTLEYLQTNAHAEGASPAERSRVLKRSQHYSYANGTLRRVMADGTTRVVPRPETRLQLVGEVHEQCGHFGVKRTKHLVLTGHWWRGVEADVKSVCSACQVCSRVNASLNATTPELHPLPIQGFMYRWHVDLAGPFERSRRGSVYVMICVEAFSKWVELVPLPNKSAAETAYAFNASVLSRFAAPAEVVTDGGSEWGGEFAALLHKAMIDHRVTSPMRPQSNGLAERAVQTSKRSLRKLCEGRNKVEDWCEQLPWISLGYRCSPQASTSFSPYYLMFGRHPVIPPAVRERMEQPLTLDDPEATAKEVHMRAEVMKRACATAADNLRIAQHRDTMRYALTHSGTYKPQLARFQVGDFVWVRRTNLSSTLQAKVQTEVLRIVKMEPHGTVVLQGQCGQTTKNHISNLAPCHLDVDPEIDFGLAPPPADLPCEVCRKPDNPDSMLLCDGCNTGWHLSCIPGKPLARVPAGAWICPYCTAKGVSLQSVARRVAAQEESREIPAESAPNVFPNAAMRKRDSEAQALDGLTVARSWIDPNTGKARTFYGTVRFMGALRRPRYFDVTFEDGEVLQWTTALVKKYKHKAAGVDSAVVAASTVVAPSPALPQAWDLATGEGVELAFTHLMPGKWARNHCTRLANEYARYKTAPGSIPCIPTDPGEVQPLLAALDFSSVHMVLDPFSGLSGIAKAFHASGVSVSTNDLNAEHTADMHEDALQPAFYRHLTRKGG